MQNNSAIVVSALIATRTNSVGVTEFLNVLASNKNKYGFPGGKLEEAETPLQAVIREVREELGVAPTSVEYSAVYNALTPEGRGLTMHVFTGKVAENIEPKNEIAELHWLTYDQMVSMTNLLTPMTIEYVLPLLKNMASTS